MSFVSVSFLFFLPIVFLLYWTMQRQLKLQNISLLIASYVFYGWWDWRFLILILITSLSSFLSGLYIAKSHNKRFFLTANICLNLGILAVFKYYGFFADNLNLLLSQFGFSLDMPTWRIILPVGISFYTFQSLSYSIDVYRGKLPATRDIVAFCTYIAFFPQLVAGPIERATNLLPQMLSSRRFDYAEAVDGLRRILWGFFKKLVIADNCAQAVNQIWDGYADANAVTLLCGMVLFAFQIYGDFSGYSDIAIGTAKLFGIRLMENFRLPYFSRSIGEFWRRWHISLMTWFRDYLYIPLGGSRVGTSRTIRNIFIVFLLSGLWHGANWTFVVWGGYNAVLLVMARWLWKSRDNADERVEVRDLGSVCFTFALVVLGWVAFRAENLSEASCYLQRFATALTSMNLGMPVYGKVTIIYCLLLVFIEWIQRDRLCPLQLDGCWLGRYRWTRWLVYYIVFMMTFFGRGEEQTFIYFQF
jgi:D-alanyl-lipoteichoic acid acyltransferase DltB (MBOAT superfamily)